MLSFIKGFGPKFHAAELTETFEALGNPGRGWYRIYTFFPGERAFEEPVRYKNETLALVLFNIGAYKDQDFPETVLREMDEILQSFEAKGFELILRICYDTEGKGMVREPSLFSQVKSHLAQVAPLIRKHAERILTCQGLLIGNWGEMHGSRYLLPKCVKELTELFLRETEGKVTLALRKPSQWRMAFPEGVKEQRVGFFNDGILGSDTHLGTFGPAGDGRKGWEEPWGIEEELRFLDAFEGQVPYGGEVLMPPFHLEPGEILKTLGALRTSYLNSTHDAALLASWKQTVYEGRSLYETVGERLGYRFLVRRVQGKWGRTLNLSLEIENAGFGSICEDAEMEVFAKAGQTEEEISLGSLEGNLRMLRSGKKAVFQGSFPVASFQGMAGNEQIFIYLRAFRKKDHAVIRFGQKNQEGSLGFLDQEGSLLLGVIKS